MVSFLFTNIHSHSTATLSFNIIHKFTFNDSSQLRIYLFTVATYLHSHSRSKFLFNTVAIFIQQFVNVLKFTNTMFLHIERFNSFSTLLQYLFNILCASLFTHSQAPACTIFWKQATHHGDLECTTKALSSRRDPNFQWWSTSLLKRTW